jgi:hypothetical protein
MLASYGSAPVTRQQTSDAALRVPLGDARSADRLCPYCRSGIAADAKKCRICGEWVVRTSAGLTPVLLRMVGWLWVGISGLTAAGLWHVADALRTRILAAAVDETFATPQVLAALVYGVVAIVVLQGLTFGLGLAVLAGLAPRRPRWWS